MQIHHIGCRASGFYHVARIGRRWQGNDQAQHRLHALRFWGDHGITAADDASKVSRRTLYR